MSFMDKMKAKAEEWDVQGKAEKFAAEVDKVAHEAKDKAAAYADENRDKVATGLDKAGAKIDERTEGKYADKIVKAKEQVTKGVDKLAEQRPGGPQGPTATPGGRGAAGAAGGAGSAWSSATDGAAAAPSPGAYSSEPYRPEPYTPEPIDDAAPIDDPGPTQTGTGWPQDTPRPQTPGHPG